MPSPSGELTRGFAVGDFNVNATAREPIVPLAARTPSPASIVHEYEPCGIAEASHLQSTDCPVPPPLPTITPKESETVTVQGRTWDSRAWKRTSPPTAPVTEGS